MQRVGLYNSHRFRANAFLFKYLWFLWVYIIVYRFRADAFLFKYLLVLRGRRLKVNALILKCLLVLHNRYRLRADASILEYLPVSLLIVQKETFNTL